MGDAGLDTPPRFEAFQRLSPFLGLLKSFLRCSPFGFFCRFRPPGALNGPRDRQKATRGGKPALEKLSRGPGAAYGKNHDVGCLGLVIQCQL